jgi:hypothetical protein
MKTVITMSKTYINSSGKQVLQYDSQYSVLLDLHFILTVNKQLKIGMPYLLLEGNHSMAVRLLEVRDDDGVVYLDIQELLTNKTHCLSWNMEYTNGYWLWSLADLDTIIELMHTN